MFLLRWRADDVFSRPEIDEVYRVERLKSTFWHLLVHTIHSSQSFGDPFEEFDGKIIEQNGRILLSRSENRGR